jgi:hypothetical protein
MTEFLSLISAFPVALFTALLSVVLLYWLMVILGAIDIDVLEFDGLVEALDGGIEGAIDALDGAVEGAADGALEGTAEGSAEGAAEGSADGQGSLSGIAGLLHVLGLHGVPLTISLSLLIFLAWVTSMFGVDAVSRFASDWTGSVLMGSLIATVSLAVAVFLTARIVKPLRPAFKTVLAPRRSSFSGRVCTVVSVRVDSRFGRAEIEDGGAGLLVDVRCNQDNSLTRGDLALVFDYDREEDVYLVSPADPGLTASKGDS